MTESRRVPRPGTRSGPATAARRRRTRRTAHGWSPPCTRSPAIRRPPTPPWVQDRTPSCPTGHRAVTYRRSPPDRDGHERRPAQPARVARRPAPTTRARVTPATSTPTFTYRRRRTPGPGRSHRPAPARTGRARAGPDNTGTHHTSHVHAHISAKDPPTRTATNAALPQPAPIAPGTAPTHGHATHQPPPRPHAHVSAKDPVARKITKVALPPAHVCRPRPQGPQPPTRRPHHMRGWRRPAHPQRRRNRSPCAHPAHKANGTPAPRDSPASLRRLAAPTQNRRAPRAQPPRTRSRPTRR